MELRRILDTLMTYQFRHGGVSGTTLTRIFLVLQLAGSSGEAHAGTRHAGTRIHVM